METENAYLFVYGTLLLPGNEFGQYLNQHCQLISSGRLKGRLYDIGRYPGAIADENSRTYVYGTIFLMNDITGVLTVLDDYEGIGPADLPPHEYKRVLHEVETCNGMVTCWVYLYALPVNQYPQIANGNYVEYLSNKSA